MSGRILPKREENLPPTLPFDLKLPAVTSKDLNLSCNVLTSLPLGLTVQVDVNVTNTATAVCTTIQSDVEPTCPGVVTSLRPDQVQLLLVLEKRSMPL